MWIALGFLASFGIFGYSFYASSEVDRLIPIYMQELDSNFDDEYE